MQRVFKHFNGAELKQLVLGKLFEFRKQAFIYPLNRWYKNRRIFQC